MTDFWQDLVWTAIRNTVVTLQAVIPSILAMLTLLALGSLLGWVAGGVIRRFARAVNLDRRSRVWGLTGALARAGIDRPPSEVIGVLAFWSIFVTFATMGIDALAIPAASGATGVLMGFLPRILSALLILVIGLLTANFVGQTALIAAVNAGFPEARFLGRAARWAVLLFAVATALTEIGIGRDMVLIAFGITFGGLILAAALAFGLGAQGLARQVLERRLRRDEPHDARETIAHL
jgi:hypothetical protein